MLYRKSVVAQASALCLVICGQAASAQTAQAPTTGGAPAELERIEITGIRANLRKAIEQKRSSTEVLESVSADDIGKLPDTTIADTLGRLPGLMASIDRGNASQISARGLGPRLTFGTLNGRELASSEPDRAVRFEQFPSELIGGAEVYKTQAARLIEGGVAATINLKTVDPLDFKERRVTASAAALYYPLAGNIGKAKSAGPRLGLSYVDQFLDRTLGVALGVSHQDQPSALKGFAHWGFNDNTTFKTPINGVDQQVKSPWGFQSLINFGNEKRDSALAKVQWKPAKGAEVTFDAYRAKNTIKEPGVEQWVDVQPSWCGGCGSYNSATVENGYVVQGVTSATGITTANVQWNQINSTNALGLNGKFDVGNWKLEADLSHSKGYRTSVWNNIRQSYSGPLTLSFDSRGSHPYMTFDKDTSDPTKYSPASSLGAGNYAWLNDSLNAAKLDLSRLVSDGFVTKVLMGLRGTRREKTYNEISWSQAATGSIPASAYERLTLSGLPQVLALKDFDSTVASSFGGWNGPGGRTPSQGDLLAGWEVKERSTSAYAQADLDFDDVLGHVLTGNVGLRVVRTTQSSSGLQSVNGASPTAVREEVSYTNVLPSLNLTWHLASDSLLRLGLGRAMARPPLDEERASRNLSRDVSSPNAPLSGSSGNPGLRPFVANQLDMSYEWYFAKESMLAIAGYYKDVKTYIGIQSDKTTIDGTPATLSRSVNGQGGRIQGLEVTFQRPLDFITPQLKDFGIYSTYALVDSNIHESSPASNPLPLNGLSRHNVKADLWYAANSFEVRLGFSRQSAYTAQPRWNAGTLVTVEPASYWSLSFSKSFLPKLEAKLQIDNLTNQRSQMYGDNNPQYTYRTWEFGRRFMLGLTYKM